MTLRRRASALAVIAVAAVSVPAAAPASAATAVATVPAAAAVEALEEVLPEDVVEDLAAPAAAEVLDALVDPGEGAVVSVAVEGDDGSFAVERVAVEASDAAEVAQVLDELPSVEAAAVDSTMRAIGAVAPPAATAGRATAAATDPRRGEQWGLDALGAEALRAAAAPTAPVVAVVDTGVDGTHEDLAGVVLRGTDYVGAGDGWRDRNGHGTHVAGTVAALVGNGLGGQGVLGRVQVLPVRVLDATGTGYTSDIAEGVAWAADHGADVINLSLGGPESDRVLAAAVAHAVRRGVVVVAAMGNEGLRGSPTSYPAALPEVLGVTALERSLARAPYSSQGSHADLAAPGSGVLSTVPGNRYGGSSGTSMATPHVAAAAAALAAAVPTAAPAEISAALTSTAEDLGAPGRDVATGYGLVDPDEALALLRASTSVLPAAPQRVRVVSTDRRAAVSFSAPSTTSGGGRPTAYELEVRGKGQPVQRPVLPAGTTTWTATGLVNGLGYEVRVRARNAGGAGPWAPTAVARPATTPTAPQRLAVRDGDRSAVVTWAAPASHGGSKITRYEVLVRGKGQEDQRLTTTGGSVTVRGLVNGLGYEVRVTAVNGPGASPAASVVARPRTLPSAPRSVSAAGGSSKSSDRTVTFRWAAPSSHGGAAITGYQVVVRESGTRRDVTLAAPKGATSLTAKGLRNGARYTAVVRAVNAAGVGPDSARTAAAVAR
ncbi:S8 family serine peptidase [uncultured Pseudokineococcus sp.]|uniref:S8 family serine peptidase n=1 Tax=uncultured Pseudokineococcus sp. TaxID=1642928 RepID=UPI0026167133|nr:S8 family serine peptidase [uncultured Pseudokineococcus sp.]